MARSKVSSAKKTPTIKLRCNGRQTNGSCCPNHAYVSHNKHEEGYCGRHLPAQGVRKMARHCDGITVAGKPCATRIQNAPLHIPSFCQRHSADAPHYVICFGKLQTGDRCNAQIKWQEPWFRFCEDHSAQLKTLTRAIDALPNDMIDEIVGYLTPIDRLALASVNRALHRLVRNASPLSIPGQELSELHVVLTDQRVATDFSRVTSSAVSQALPTSEVAVPLPRHWLRPRAGEPANEILTIFAVPCRCSTPGQMTMNGDGSTQPSCLHRLKDTLMEAVAMKDWLFKLPGHISRCIKCRTALTAGDIVNWNKNYPNWYKKSREDGPEIWSLPLSYPQAVQKKTLLCKDCLIDGTGPYMTWCKRCFGKPSALAIARAYWATQYPLGHPESLR